MGKTYKHTPIALPDIFEQIVSEVQTNLASESSLSIPQVNFKHGTMMDISAELVADSKSTTKKLIRYPLVCLIYKADEKFVDEYEPEITVDLLVCTATQKTYSNDQRYDINIKPVIYPIYAELKSVISKSNMFWGYKKGSDHTKIDLPHAGQESAQGNTAYDLQDVIDGLMIKALKLKVAVTKCPAPARNLCLLTPCPYGLDLFFYTVFKNVTFSGLSSDTIKASVNDWLHLDNTVPMALPLPWSPEIDWQGDGNFQAMTAPTAPDTNWTSSFNVTTGYGPGTYRGIIKNGNAQVEFFYKVLAGLVVSLMDEITQDIEFSIACADAPAYPATISASAHISKVITEPSILNGYSLQVFGITKATQTFTETDTIDKTVTTTLVHGDSNQSIINNFSYAGGQSPLQQISIYKTRCKTSF